MQNNPRPKIRPELETMDRLLEGLSVLALLLLLVLPAWYYSDLPDVIPQHFNARGEADGFGSKIIIWTLPMLGVILFGILTPLSRMPHIFNYSVKITEENAAFQYKIAGRMVRGLTTVVLGMFVWITWKMIDGAISGSAHLGVATVWIFLGSLAGLLGWYLMVSQFSR